MCTYGRITDLVFQNDQWEITDSKKLVTHYVNMSEFMLKIHCNVYIYIYIQYIYQKTTTKQTDKLPKLNK